MEQHTLKNVNNYLNTNNYSYLETSGGQSSNLYLNVVHFFNTSVYQTSVAASDSCFLAQVSKCAVLLESLYQRGALYSQYSIKCYQILDQGMDKIQLTGRTLGRILNSRRVCMHAMHLLSGVAIRPNLVLKTRPKQLLGSLQLDIVLSDQGGSE